MISLDEIKKMADPGYTVGRDHIRMEHPLDKETVFEQFLQSYSVYYDVVRADEDTDNPKFELTGGFDAEARFDSKSEQYFLIRAAKVADIRSAEYVFFSKRDILTYEALSGMDERVWELCLERTKPGPDHKNTDALLVVIAHSVTGEAKDFIKKTKHSKNYRFALYGFSNYRLVVVELDKGMVYFSKQARFLMKLVGNILKEEKENSK